MGHPVTTDQRKEHSAMFLMDDIFRLARESIVDEARIHLHDFGGTDHFLDDHTIIHTSENTNSEAATIYFTSQLGSVSWPSYSGKLSDGDDSSVYAYKSDETRSKSTAKWSLGSKTIRSRRTLTSLSVASQGQDETLSGRLSSSADVPLIKLSPINLENAQIVPEIQSEDESAKYSRHTEEERAILASLHLISLKALESHILSSKLPVSQDFAVDASRRQHKEIDALNHQRGSQLEMLRRDQTVSSASPTSLVEHEGIQTLSSLVTSKCEAKEVIEWKDLMEWFVCAVIGLYSKALCGDDLPGFDWDDVVIDEFGIVWINIFPSNPDSSLPPSPHSFSVDLANLSKLFLFLIDRISATDCLDRHLDKHFLNTLIPSILQYLIRHLISTGALIPVCGLSEMEELVRESINACHATLPNDLNLDDCLKWIMREVLIRVYSLEADPHSPTFTNFTKLLEPALIEIRKHFDPDLYEEAKRMTSWMELLRKLALGKEILNDVSFLKLSFFKPTLLSLQEKLQNLISTVDESDEKTKLSPHSSHSSPHSPHEANLDSPFRTLSSSSHLRQEFVQLLTTLHSLVTSFPTSITPSRDTEQDLVMNESFIGSHVEHVDPTEKFSSSLFDEFDDETLARSLVRCRRVCELVGVEECILDFKTFFDRTVSILSSSNRLVRTAARSLFDHIVDMPSVLPQLPYQWNRLRSAFHDGWPEEQHTMLLISTKWIKATRDGASLPPFPVSQFDWDGLIQADLSGTDPLIDSISLIGLLKHTSIADRVGQATETSRIPRSVD
ncbi:hypothetical protein BLNAU_4378 [Blattamonas nauphoetae]|uniref:Uncharacterized protein n=1 Tax=Blattamonas nauphoetae TaxID=2049346 RepID=A0ABQ9YAC4_9EUKA|nr:hypothetical protein BLNAU_4378 [Blattamonas nauphoetae]